MIRFEPAEPRHAPIVARSMRARDVEEICAGWGEEPTAAILRALEGSYFARVAWCDMEPLAIYGLTALCVLSLTAQIWIFGTRHIDAHPLAFARASRTAVKELSQHASRITNLIDWSDAPARKWMEWLGGTYVLRDHNRGGRLFRQFFLGGGPCRRA